MLARLRAAGLRPTPARVCILQVLAAEPGRLQPVDEIYRSLIARGTQVSLASVYRVVKELCEHSLALREWREAIAVYRPAPHEPGATGVAVAPPHAASQAPAVLRRSSLH